MLSGPPPLAPFWKETRTCPPGPTAMLPKLGTKPAGAPAGLGTLTTGRKFRESVGPSRPLTAAPVAWSEPPRFHTSHTEFAPTVTFGWSSAGQTAWPPVVVWVRAKAPP